MSDKSKTLSPNYILATSAGYKINIGDEGYNPYDSLTLRNKAEFTDAVISRPNQFTDMYDLHKYALVTVNGFIHPTSFTDERLFVKRAVPQMLKCGYNHVGIISFQNIGEEIQKIHITEDMISRTDDYTMYEKLLITLPEEIDGFFLVFAGYVIVADENILTQVGPKTYAFFPSRINLMDRIYELSRYYDIFDELGIESSPNNEHAVLFSDMSSDETIVKLLTRFNSFFVTIKGYSITPKVTQLEHTAVPNNYRTELLPSKPLLGGRGKIIEYKAVKYNRFKWTVLTVDSYYNTIINNFTPKYALNIVNDARVPCDLYRLSAVGFLELEFRKFEYDK